MSKKPIILLVGPSGSGKSTISRELHEKYGLKELQSYTTRKPRFPHEPGHTFVTDEEFDTLKDQVAFTDFNGHRYCATAQQVNDNDIYVVDLEGCRTFQKTYHGDKIPMAFWIECDPAIIRQRMFLRDALWKPPAAWRMMFMRLKAAGKSWASFSSTPSSSRIPMSRRRLTRSCAVSISTAGRVRNDSYQERWPQGRVRPQ